MNSEYLDIVDETNTIIGVSTRKEVYERGFNHRIVHVMLENSEGQLLLQQRVQEEDGSLAWSSSVGGHVGKGENYSEAAGRELSEEYETQTFLELETMGDISSTDPRGMTKFIRAFKARVTEPMFLRSSEAEVAIFFSLEEIQMMADEDGNLFHSELRIILASFYHIKFS